MIVKPKIRVLIVPFSRITEPTMTDSYFKWIEQDKKPGESKTVNITSYQHNYFIWI